MSSVFVFRTILLSFLSLPVIKMIMLNREIDRRVQHAIALRNESKNEFGIRFPHNLAFVPERYRVLDATVDFAIEHDHLDNGEAQRDKPETDNDPGLAI